MSADTLRGPTFRTPYSGVRIPATAVDGVAMRARAALLALPSGAVLSCHTAAELRALPVPPQRNIHADLPPPQRASRVHGITAHVRPAPATLVKGLPVSSPEVMFLELAAYLDVIQLVVLGDALLRHGWTSPEALRRTVAGATRRRGVVRARRAVGLVRPDVDSPMETRVRLLVVLAGLPCPQPGYRVIIDGQLIGRVDLALPAYRVALEYDGDLHRVLKRKWRLDVATREALRDAGWTVIVLTWDDCAVTPARTVGRVARALARNGCAEVPRAWRDGAADPRTLSAEWRLHFPGGGAQAWDWADAPAS